MQAAVLLEIRHIEKRFGVLTGLADVSLTINPRESMADRRTAPQYYAVTV